MERPRRLTLQRALLVLLGGAVIAGVVPAGVVLHYRVQAELENRTRDDLERALRIVGVRNSALADAMMMHAKDLAGLPALVAAVAQNRRDDAARVAREAAAAFGEVPVLVDGSEQNWVGPTPPRSFVAATRRGEMPTAIVATDGGMWRVSLAPVKADGRWIGAAGVAVPVDGAEAGLLAGLTRAVVTIVRADDRVVGSTSPGALAEALARTPLQRNAAVAIVVGGRSYLAARAPLDSAGEVVLARSRDDELALLPQLRRVAIASALAALVLALVVGTLVARWIARPVEALAVAADEVASGRFTSPVPESAVREVSKVGRAFDAMRRALVVRLGELQAANRELAQRQDRLSALQAELIQRERLAATGQLIGSLAHEIRNPIANVRNCLEVVRRRLAGGVADAQTGEFVDLAIDELLRMHELAEQMLDLNRPRDSAATHCDAVAVARNVARLTAVAPDDAMGVCIAGASQLELPLSPDRFTQVLLNLVQNAREAQASQVDIRIVDEPDIAAVEVEDDGSGIDPEHAPRVFDPFYTTKGSVRGAGLGLFVAEGIVRAAGGRITAGSRVDGERGARLRLEFPHNGNRVN